MVGRWAAIGLARCRDQRSGGRASQLTLVIDGNSNGRQGGSARGGNTNAGLSGDSCV